MAEVSNITPKWAEVFGEAENEIKEETIRKAKIKIKSKLLERDQAKRVLANIERELKEFELEIRQDLEEVS